MFSWEMTAWKISLYNSKHANGRENQKLNDIEQKILKLCAFLGLFGKLDCYLNNKGLQIANMLIRC